MEGSAQGPFSQGYQLSNLFSHNEFFSLLTKPSYLFYSKIIFIIFTFFLHYFKYIFFIPETNLDRDEKERRMRGKLSHDQNYNKTCFSSFFLYDVQKSPLKPPHQELPSFCGQAFVMINLSLRTVVLVSRFFFFTCSEEG